MHGISLRIAKSLKALRLPLVFPNIVERLSLVVASTTHFVYLAEIDKEKMKC